MVVPRSLIGPVSNAKRLADRDSPRVTQQALVRFITDGHFERLLRQTRVRNQRKRDALITGLAALHEHLNVFGSPSGLHLIAHATNPDLAALDRVLDACAGHGLGVYSTAQYYLNIEPKAGLLFGFNAVTLPQIQQGLRILGTCFHRARHKNS